MGQWAKPPPGRGRSDPASAVVLSVQVVDRNALLLKLTSEATLPANTTLFGMEYVFRMEYSFGMEYSYY